MEVKRVINKKCIIYCLLVLGFILGYYLYYQNGKLKITDKYGDEFYVSKDEYYKGYSRFYDDAISKDNWVVQLQNDKEHMGQLDLLYDCYLALKDDPELLLDEIEALRLSDEITEEFFEKKDADPEFCQKKEWNLKISYIDELCSRISNAADYTAGIEKITQNADELLSFETIVKKGSFSYNNLIKTKEDFERISDVRVEVVNDFGITSVLNISIIPYLIFAMALIIPVSFLEERKNGLWSLVHHSKGGRARLSLIRSFICIIGSVALSCIVYLALFVLSLFKYGGANTLFKSVQSIKGFERCIISVSTIEMLLIIAIFTGLAIGVLVLLTSMFMELFRNSFLGLLLVIICLVCSWLMYSNITDQMAGAFFKYFNLASILDPVGIFSKYLNIRIINSAIFRPGFEIALVFMISIVIMLMRMLIANKVKPAAGYSVITSVINKILVYKEILVEKLSWGLKEAYYQLFVNKTIVVFAIGLFLVFDLKIYTGVIKDKDNYALDSVYDTYTGSFSENEATLNDYIEDLNTSILLVESEYESIKEKFLAGEASQNEMFKFHSLNENMSLKRGMIEQLSHQKEYLEKHKSSNVWILDNRGYDLWMSENYARHTQLLGVLGIMGAIFFTALLYEEDKKKGLYDIIHAAPGRRRYAFKKRLVLGGMVFVFSFGLFLIDFILMRRTFELSGLGSSVYSVGKWCSLPFSMPIWLFVGLVIVGKAVFITILSQLGLGIIKKRKAVVGIAMLFIVLLPYLFTVIGWNGFSTVDISRLLSLFEEHFAGV